MTLRATCVVDPALALTSQYDLSGVKASKKDKFAGDSPASSATGVNMAEAGASEKENKQLDQRGAPIGSSVNGPMGAGPVHPSGDSTDAGHQAWERERNLMRCVPRTSLHTLTLRQSRSLVRRPPDGLSEAFEPKIRFIHFGHFVLVPALIVYSYSVLIRTQGLEGAILLSQPAAGI